MTFVDSSQGGGVKVEGWTLRVGLPRRHSFSFHVVAVLTSKCSRRLHGRQVRNNEILFVLVRCK